MQGTQPAWLLRGRLFCTRGTTPLRAVVDHPVDVWVLVVVAKSRFWKVSKKIASPFQRGVWGRPKPALDVVGLSQIARRLAVQVVGWPMCAYCSSSVVVLHSLSAHGAASLSPSPSRAIAGVVVNLVHDRATAGFPVLELVRARHSSGKFVWRASGARPPRVVRRACRAVWRFDAGMSRRTRLHAPGGRALFVTGRHPERWVSSRVTAGGAALRVTTR